MKTQHQILQIILKIQLHSQDCQKVRSKNLTHGSTKCQKSQLRRCTGYTCITLFFSHCLTITQQCHGIHSAQDVPQIFIFCFTCSVLRPRKTRYKSVLSKASLFPSITSFSVAFLIIACQPLSNVVAIRAGKD